MKSTLEKIEDVDIFVGVANNSDLSFSIFISSDTNVKCLQRKG